MELPPEIWVMVTGHLRLGDIAKLHMTNCYLLSTLRKVIDAHERRWWPLQIATIYPQVNIVCRCPSILDLKTKDIIRDPSCRCH